MNYGIHSDDYTHIKDTLLKAVKLKVSNVQIFLGNKVLTTLREKFKPNKQEIKEIKDLLKKHNLNLYIHGLLTLNFCNDPNNKRFTWGLTNLLYDLNVGQQLGAKAVIIHAGRYITKKYSLTKQQCYTHFIDSLKYVIDHSKKINVYIETPSHEKNTIVNSIQEMADLYNQIPLEYKKRIHICVDTCHIFVSNVNISSKQGVIDYFQLFDDLIGLKHLKLIHLNDSYGELGSHLDRHAPIGQGYIFKDHKEGLIELLKYIKKYNIPVILETNKDTFDKNLTILKKYEKQNEGKQKEINNKDKKNKIINIFKDLLHYYETLGNKTNKSTPFRISSYKKAIQVLEKSNKIYSLNNIKQLNTLGTKTINKISTILKNNYLPLHDNILKNKDNVKLLKNFQNIYGVGPIFAKKLLNNGVKSINELRNKVKNNEIILSNSQLLGLKYYDNLKERIPYDEITEITKVLKKKLNEKKLDIELLNAGSYAMKKKTSGDIDYILVFNSLKNNVPQLKKEFYIILKKNKFYKGHLLDGKAKDIYLFQLNDKSKVRHLDILYVPEEEKYFQILYFSSSSEFSKNIRLIASKKGYKLNEKGLFDKKTGKKIKLEPTSEKDIFEYLNIPFVKQENRNK